MKIAIASGKGGVGKSMLASSLAILFSRKLKIVACDCDVDAPNLGIWLGIRKYDKEEDVYTSEKAFINQSNCNNCEYCTKLCPFDAIKKDENGKIRVETFLCEGCGLCEILCPNNSFKIEPVKNGKILINNSKYNFPIVSGMLLPGEHGSGKIVEELKNRINEFEYDVAILDSAAGIGCPVVASLRGSDYVILVVEPTPPSISDLKRIMKVVNYFNLDFGVVINKSNMNIRLAKSIEKKFSKHLIGKLSYDKCVFDALKNMKPVVEFDCKIKDEIKVVYKKLLDILRI